MDPKSVISVVLVLGGLIFFHELGHFVVARFLKMGVATFSLGFGPSLLGFTRGKTRYILSAIPLGGYVQLVGQDAGEEIPEGFGRESWFCLRPAWQRALVVAAGPVFNFLLAWLIYWGLIFSMGVPEYLPTVGAVQEGSPAQAAGMLPGDKVLTIDGAKVSYWRELSQTVREGGGRMVELSIDRNGEIFSISLTPRIQVLKNWFGEDEKVPLLGLARGDDMITLPLGAGSSALEGLKRTWHFIDLTLMGVVKLVQGVVPLNELGGPIMIAQQVSRGADRGLAEVLSLMAFISINLGILNLLPIPVLDGGHILFFGLEAILRRPVSLRVQQVTTRFGLAFLLLLMALALYNDIQRMLV